MKYRGLCQKNIARGTTDPEIDSVTWIKLGNSMAPLREGVRKNGFIKDFFLNSGPH